METKEPGLCAGGCGFFGSASTKGMCSRCYRQWLAANPQPAGTAAAEQATGASTNAASAATPQIVISSNSRSAGTHAPMAVEDSTGAVPGLIPSAPISIPVSSALAVPGSAVGASSCPQPGGFGSSLESTTPVTTLSRVSDSDTLGSSPSSVGNDPNRCQVCNKKTGLTPFVCRCLLTFCAKHRYPNEHNCNFDYKALGREQLAKDNPVVKASKIQKI